MSVLDDFDVTSGRVRVDAFLIGAPKCGTTWLASALSGHRDVCFSHPKEPNIISSHRGTFGRLPQSIDWERYRACYKREGLRIDGSVHAFADPDAPRYWRRHFPSARFILCVRHPTERAVSHWNMIRTTSKDAAIGVSWQNFKHAWEDPRLHMDSLYGRSMRRWLEHFDLSRFLILDSCQMQSAPVEVFDRALEFLGLEAMELPGAARLPLNVAERRPAITAFGRMLKQGLPQWLVEAGKRAMNQCGVPWYRLPVVSTTPVTDKCLPYHHSVCSEAVVPDLTLFHDITGFDTSRWIETSVSLSSSMPRRKHAYTAGQ